MHEGVVLIETGYDASSFLRKIIDCADEIRGENLRNRGVLWTYDGYKLSGGEPIGTNMQQYHPGFHEITSSGFMSHIGITEIEKIHAVGDEILAHCLGLIDNSKTWSNANVTLVNLSNRTRGGNLGHIDAMNDLTIWHGASHPGLRINRPSGFMNIPGAPEGYCLVWRGAKLVGAEHATRHSVCYTGRVPRVSLVTF